MSKATPNFFNFEQWFSSVSGYQWGQQHAPKGPSPSAPTPASSGGATGPTTTLTVTFQSEDASYASAMGWYNARTGEAGILFKNTNDDGWNAGVKAGDTRSLTVLQSDVDANNVGFFMIPNGANELSSSLLSSSMKFQVNANGDGKIVIDRQYGSDVVLSGSDVLFSNQVYNKGDFDYVSGKVGTQGQTWAQKNGAQSDGADGILGTMAWDDQAMNGCGGTDRDFNDVVFTVTKSGGTNPPPNGAPTDINLSSATIAENAVGAVVGMLSTVDPNAGDKHTYTVSDNRFEVVNGQLKLKAGTSLNYENGSSVELTVTTTDQGGLSYSENFKVAVTNVNEGPTDISVSNLSVYENASGAVIGKVSTTDPDAGNTHSYTVSDNRFQVVNGELKLVAGKSLDYETESSVELKITSKDQGGLTYTESFTVQVKDVSETPVNQAPTDLTLSGATVTEHVAGSVIGAVVTIDPNAADTHTYKVDDDRFEVVGGQLKLKSGVSLDYEVASSVVVNITTTDQGGLTYSEGFKISVTDGNDPPTEISISNVTIPENEAGIGIGSLMTIDPNPGDTHTYTVSDDRFEVVGDLLKLKDGVSLDFDATPSVAVTVTSTDKGGLSFSQQFTIVVEEDVGSGPTSESGPSGDSFIIDLNMGLTSTLVGFNSASDILSFTGVFDADSNGVDLNDLLSMVLGVGDFGSGSDIVVEFTSGSTLVFQGAGTPDGNVSSLTSMVSNPGTQIHVA